MNGDCIQLRGKQEQFKQLYACQAGPFFILCVHVLLNSHCSSNNNSICFNAENIHQILRL